MNHWKLTDRGYNCWVEVNLSATTHNVRLLKALAGPDRKLMVCVKADSYGHGLIPVAKAALEGGADRLCVATLDEALDLQRGGITCPIQILLQPPVESAEILSNHKFIPTLSSPETVLKMASMISRPLTVHVEVDTGMGRVNLKPKDVVSFLDLIKSTGKFRVEGLFSHFCCATTVNDPASKAFTEHQFKLFCDTLSSARNAGYEFELAHIANSGAIQLYPHTYLDMIRTGFLVTGIPTDWISLPLRPSLSWKSRIQYLLDAPKGQTVGYECSHAVEQKTTLAAVSCGYADGYPPQIGGCPMEVIIHGARAKVLGRVGMNQMLVDVGKIPDARAGDEVILIGGQGETVITADDIAKRSNSIPAIVICSISKDVPRVYHYDEEAIV